ncbi:MAG: helix-turn-helix domain-containing protein [Nocardioides sp.]|nr:helix-turn-helix domain-containing protein [Nocardioides sp.]
MDETTEAAEVTALRAVAHPVRLRMLSMLTGEAMSAAEVARALDLTHANASYHLRVLHDAGELVVESEEKVRGGTARRYRYRYDAAVDERRGPRDAAARIADARATQLEVERRLLEAAPGSGSASDLEAWVPLEAWRRALDLVHEASMLLHDEARPAGSPDTVHVSATWNAFTMTGGLTGEAAGWRP